MIQSSILSLLRHLGAITDKKKNPEEKQGRPPANDEEEHIETFSYWEW